MELRAYLKANNLSEAKFAELIGVKQSAVNRYCKRLRVPKGKIMPKIVEATAGAVTANDFVGQPPKRRKRKSAVQ